MMVRNAVVFAAAAVVTWCACATPVANADPNDGVAINGTYTAFSDGQWAKTDDSYHDEASVTQTWTITSTCTTFQDCTGTVTSDQGWSSDNLLYMSGRWKVSHTVVNWEHCQDGTAVPGEQAFTFWRGYPDKSKISGLDQTIGPSGACGFSKWLHVSMPLRLTPVG
jgi:hypothetical protein